MKHAHREKGRARASGILLTVIIAAGAVFLIRAIAPDSDDAAREVRSGEPDVHMTGTRLRRFDAAGALEYELLAREARYFREAGRAEIVAPELTLYEDARAAWQVSAGLGTLLGSGVGGTGEDEIRLADDVRLMPLEGHIGRLATATLTLFPDRQYAETDQTVIIDAESGRTTAAGLEGDLQGGLLKLLSSSDRPVQTVLLPGRFN